MFQPVTVRSQTSQLPRCSSVLRVCVSVCVCCDKTADRLSQRFGAFSCLVKGCTEDLWPYFWATPSEPYFSKGLFTAEMKIDSSSSSSFGAEERLDRGLCDVCKKMRCRERYLWSWPLAERFLWTFWTPLLICLHLASCHFPESVAPLLPSASPLEDRKCSSVSHKNHVVFHDFISRWSTDVITACHLLSDLYEF